MFDLAQNRGEVFQTSDRAPGSVVQPSRVLAGSSQKDGALDRFNGDATLPPMLRELFIGCCEGTGDTGGAKKRILDRGDVAGSSGVVVGAMPLIRPEAILDQYPIGFPPTHAMASKFIQIANHLFPSAAKCAGELRWIRT